MANAADYLLLDTTQLITTYKLRTRSIDARRFVATNIAPNYVLSVNITPTISGVNVTPSAFRLRPNEVATVTVEYDTAILETLPPGTLEGALNMTVSAEAIVIPQPPVSPAPPPLPDAPRQIISRIQLIPTAITLTTVGETTQFTPILYVDDVAVPATFRWNLTNDLANAFSISDDGIVKSLINGINVANVEAIVVTPAQYEGTTGIATVASNVAVVSPQGGPTIPITGNLRVVIGGMTGGVGANVSISGINQSITETTTFSQIPAGVYTVTPNVVNIGGLNYNPTGGGTVYVAPGRLTEVTINYTRQSPPDQNSIQIVKLIGRGGDLRQGQFVNTNEQITVIARTYRNGAVANIGDVQFTATNTREGVQSVQANASGEYSANFTVLEPGVVTITAFNQLGGSVTGQIGAFPQSVYTIRLSAPSSLIAGQCTPVTAVVLKDGVETNIPVQIDIGGIGARIGVDPCRAPEPTTFTEVVIPQPVLIPEPTATGTSAATGRTVGMDFTRPIVDRATTTSRTLNEAELRTGGNSGNIGGVVFVDQGELAI